MRFAAALLGALAPLAACGVQGAGAGDAGTGAKAALGLGIDPQTAKIDLGRRLMFDDRLSRPRGVACATCHDPFLGWGDGRPQGKGIQDNTLAGDTLGGTDVDHNEALAVAGTYFKTILTPRNTPTVYNAHVFPNLFWDGRAGDLHHQSQFPFEAGPEMNSSWTDHILPLLAAEQEYVDLFQAAYGTEPTRVDAADAIGAYEATISVFDTPYDEFLAGDGNALSPLAMQGHDLFFGAAGCGACHPSPLLTSMEFLNTGVPSAGVIALQGGVDLGRGLFTDLTQDPPVDVDVPADYAKFKVPQLRMVAHTGPYMHNGALATLEDVVEFYDAGGGPDLSGTGTKDPRIVPLGLSVQDKEALVAFLRDGLNGTPIR